MTLCYVPLSLFYPSIVLHKLEYDTFNQYCQFIQIQICKYIDISMCSNFEHLVWQIGILTQLSHINSLIMFNLCFKLKMMTLFQVIHIRAQNSTTHKSLLYINCSLCVNCFNCLSLQVKHLKMGSITLTLLALLSVTWLCK